MRLVSSATPFADEQTEAKKDPWLVNSSCRNPTQARVTPEQGLQLITGLSIGTGFIHHESRVHQVSRWPVTQWVEKSPSSPGL